MPDHPRVSVILPTRNRAMRLEAAIATVRAQTFADWELIVVDDGSTDGTAQLLEALQAQEPRVRVVRRTVGHGAAAARNAGLAGCDGEFVAFQDDDCRWHPEKLALLVSVFEAAGPTCAMAYSPVEEVWPSGARQIVGAARATDRLRGPWSAGTPAVMVRRASLVAVGGFDPELPRLEDFDLWVRLLRGREYAFVPQVLVTTTVLPGGVSTNTAALVAASRRIATKCAQDGGLPASEHAAICRGLAHSLLVHGEAAEGRRLLRHAVRRAPTAWSAWLALGASCFGSFGYRHATTWWARCVGGSAVSGSWTATVMGGADV